jgi:hypothetical protein
VTVTLPTRLHGWTKMEGKQYTREFQNTVALLPPEVHARGAVYGRAGVPQATVIVAAFGLAPGDKRLFLKGFAEAEKEQFKVTMHPVAAGPLGGELRCGTSAGHFHTDCYFVDDGAFGVIDLAGHPKDYHAIVLAIRAAVEHKVG